jgi:hypothetical protein
VNPPEPYPLRISPGTQVVVRPHELRDRRVANRLTATAHHVTVKGVLTALFDALRPRELDSRAEPRSAGGDPAQLAAGTRA